MSELMERIEALVERDDLTEEQKQQLFDEILEGFNFKLPEVFGNAAVSFVDGGATFHGGVGRTGLPELLMIYRNPDGEMRGISTSFEGNSVQNLFKAIDEIKAGMAAPEDSEEREGSLPFGHTVLLQIVDEYRDREPKPN
jgi:hypothetical protein